VSVNERLIEGESIVFESKKHWMAPIHGSLVAVLLILGACLVWLIAPGGGEGLLTIDGAVGFLMRLVAVGLVTGGVARIVYVVVAWRTARFAVTNMRVLSEDGLASRHSSTTRLSSLSDVNVHVGFVGSRLGYGDITLLTRSSRAGVVRFPTITTPAAFRDAVVHQKMQLGGDQSLERIERDRPPA
jgi:hypothetical protein